MADSIWDKINEAVGIMELGDTASPKIRPAGDYKVYTGNETEIQFEQQYSVPMDGSNSLLRVLSPFTIRVLPPLVYRGLPGLLDGTEKGSKTNPIQLGLIEQVAQQAGSVFAGAKQTAQNFTLDNEVTQDTAIEDQYVVGGRVNTRGSPAAAKGVIPKDYKSAGIQDMQIAHSIGIQLERILNMPPLTLLINPDSLQIQYQKIQQYSERSREGIIFQAYGEEQPRMTIAGRIGAFYAGDGGLFDPKAWSTRVPTGVQFATKRDSASFQQLMTLLAFYKNNGYIFDILGGSCAHHLIGVISIDYDQNTYLGNFNSFSWSYEEAQHGGGITFNMEMTVVQQYDNHQAIRGSLEPLGAPEISGTDPRLRTGGPITPDGSAVNFLEVGTNLVSAQIKSLAAKSSPKTTLPPSSNGIKIPGVAAPVPAAQPVPRQDVFNPRGR